MPGLKRAKVHIVAWSVALLLSGATSFAAQPALDPDAAMANLPALRDQALKDRAQGGEFRCPDGTSRSYTGEAPNELFKTMKCSGPAESAEASPAEKAMEAKNAAVAQEAALSGQSGVKAGLEATVATGQPDYLLRFPWVWAIGVVAVFALAGTILSRLLRGRK